MGKGRHVQQNHYKLLELPYSASRKQIIAAYRTQMRQWHPDRFQGEDKSQAEEYAKRLNLAYSVLSDAHKREEYDRSLRVEAIQSELMERYVAGYSGWNLGGSAPAADAPRRARSTAEQQEMRNSGNRAIIGVIMAFAFLALLAMGLQLIFAILQAIVN